MPGGDLKNFAVLLNVAQLADFVRATIRPGHIVRHATREEAEAIRVVLAELSRPYRATWLYEAAAPFSDGPVELLAPRDWRYFVVAFSGANADMNTLENAMCISNPSFRVGPTFFNDPGFGQGLMINRGKEFQFFDNIRNANVMVPMTRADVDSVSTLASQLDAHDHSTIDLHDAMSKVQHLHTLPRASPLRYLGYFGVLESLIAHAPKPTDPYDSITRQTRQKMALLNNRFLQPLDYSVLGGMAAEKAWSKLYSYRSAVAHGAKTDFSGEFAALGTAQKALHFLMQATHAVIRQALIEPALLRDLREC